MKKTFSDMRSTQQLHGPTRVQSRPGARLVVIHGENLGLCLELMVKPVTVGRSPSCEMHIDHPSVSRMHCTVWSEDEHFYVRDLGSTNRTLVNERAVDKSELRDGDTITIGEIVLKFLRRESLQDRYHQAMVEMANVDDLTQLPNRRVWREQLERAVIQAQSGTPLCLAFIDLDYFKRINDELGHLVGDQALRAVAEVIRDSLHSGFTGGRLGGEEFAVILPYLELERAAHYAETLCRSIARLQLQMVAGSHSITASIGVVQWRSDMQTSTDFMRAADAEMFRAKSEGRNRVCVATSA